MKNLIGSHQHHPASMADLKTVTDINTDVLDANPDDNPFSSVEHVIELLAPSAIQRPSKPTRVPFTPTTKNNNLDGLKGEMSELIRMVAEIRHLDDTTTTGTATNKKTKNIGNKYTELKKYLKDNEDNIAKYLAKDNGVDNIEDLFGIRFSEWNDFLSKLSQPKLNQTSTGIDFTIQVDNKETTLFTTNTEQKGGGYKTGYNIPQLKTFELIQASIKAVIVSHQSISAPNTPLKINLENFDQDSILKDNTILVDEKPTLDPEAIEKHRDILQIELTQLKTFAAHHYNKTKPLQEISNIEEVEEKINSIIELSGLGSYKPMVEPAPATTTVEEPAPSPMVETVSPEELYEINNTLLDECTESKDHVGAKNTLKKIIALLEANPELDDAKKVGDLKEELKSYDSSAIPATPTPTPTPFTEESDENPHLSPEEKKELYEHRSGEGDTVTDETRTSDIELGMTAYKKLSKSE